jgi:V8-like Glu-specific endopeptidase
MCQLLGIAVVLLGIASTRVVFTHGDGGLEPSSGLLQDPESIVQVLDLPSSNVESPWISQDQQQGERAWIFPISKKGCKSARVHLSDVNLDNNSHFLVYGQSGDQRLGVEKFTGKGGRNGNVYTHRVWAEKLVLNLFQAETNSSFTIRYVHYGDCDIVDKEKANVPRVVPGVCGKNNWKNAICYIQDDPETYRLASSVVKLLFVVKKEAYVCSGFKISDDDRFMTNWHCLGTQQVVETAEVLDHYDSTSCEKDNGRARRTLNGDSLIWTSGSDDYDVTIFSVKDKKEAEYIPCLVLSDKNPNIGQRIDIIEHPEGKLKKISIKSDEDKGGYCIIDKYEGPYTFKNYWCYKCDMAQGASGSPVLDYESGGVVGLNSFIIDNCPNFGTKISKVLKKAGKRVGSCSQASVVDTAVRWPESQLLFLFRGTEFWRYNESCSCIDLGPWNIPEYWPGLPTSLDASLLWTDGNIYFFKGRQYYKYNVKKDRVDIGYPKPIKSGWRGVPNDIDAALALSNETAYFFKGPKFWTFSKGKGDSGEINKSTWPGIPADVSAALVQRDSVYYFFKQKQFYKFGELDGQYPQTICETLDGLPCY